MALTEAVAAAVQPTVDTTSPIDVFTDLLGAASDELNGESEKSEEPPKHEPFLTAPSIVTFFPTIAPLPLRGAFGLSTRGDTAGHPVQATLAGSPPPVAARSDISPPESKEIPEKTCPPAPTPEPELAFALRLEDFNPEQTDRPSPVRTDSAPRATPLANPSPHANLKEPTETKLPSRSIDPELSRLPDRPMTAISPLTPKPSLQATEPIAGEVRKTDLLNEEPLRFKAPPVPARVTALPTDSRSEPIAAQPLITDPPEETAALPKSVVKSSFFVKTAPEEQSVERTVTPLTVTDVKSSSGKQATMHLPVRADASLKLPANAEPIIAEKDVAPLNATRFSRPTANDRPPAPEDTSFSKPIPAPPAVEHPTIRQTFRNAPPKLPSIPESDAIVARIPQEPVEAPKDESVIAHTLAKKAPVQLERFQTALQQSEPSHDSRLREIVPHKIGPDRAVPGDVQPQPAAIASSPSLSTLPEADTANRPATETHSEPVAPLAPTLRSTPKSEVTEVSLSVPGSSTNSDTAGRIGIRMVQRGAEIHVAVRTPDPHAAQAMRQDLSQLATSLEDAGFQTEAWRPGVSVSATPSTHGQRDFSNPPQGDNRGFDTSAGQSDSRNPGEQKRRQPDDRPRWVAELEKHKN